MQNLIGYGIFRKHHHYLRLRPVKTLRVLFSFSMSRVDPSVRDPCKNTVRDMVYLTINP